MGHAVGKRNKRAGQQTRVAEKTRTRLASFLSFRSELLPAPRQPSPREPRLDHKTKCTALHDYESVMARISGLEKSEAPWYLRWFYCVMQKMFGKDFTPVKIQMRLPRTRLGRNRHGSGTRP